MIKLVEVIKDSGNYNLREIFINPKHVVYLREDILTKQSLVEGKFPEELDIRQQFTKLTVHNGTSGTEFVVVGSPSVVESKLKDGQKMILNG
jgi:hypothetical protein